MARQGKHASGVSMKRIIGAVLAIAILSFWTVRHANFVLGRSLLLAFPGADVTYKSAWPRLTGGVTAHDVTLVPPDGGEGGTLHFDSVRVEVPLWQYLRSGFSRRGGALLNSIKDLRLVFDGGQGDMADWGVSNELVAFGNVSASPFEAMGCLKDNVWVSDELTDMGLTPHGTELVMAWQRTAGSLVKEQSIHTPGVGEVSFRREMRMHDGFSLFSLVETGLSEVTADEWHVRDEGFVAARNAYCAKKDGITAAQFVERHVASVKRALQAVGLTPRAPMEAAYRRFAGTGGTLDLSLRYDPPIGGSLYENTDLGAWVPRLHGEFAVAGERMAIALDSTPVRPLPESGEDEGDAGFYAQMQREGSAPQEAANDAMASATPPAVGSASAAAPSPPVVALAPAVPPVSTVTAAPAPAGARSGAAVTSGAAAAPVTAVPTPVPAAPSSITATPPTAHPARSLDSVASIAAPQPLAAADERDEVRTLGYAELGAAVGQRVTVFLVGREPMQAEVLGVVKGVVQIRRHLRSGWVEYAVDRASFDHAERRD